MPSIAPLPTTLAEAQARDWDELDVVLVSGDAYVDHPAFAAALLGRVLEAEGFRVGVLSQPDWRRVEPFRALGRPRLYFGVTAGNVDSMVAHQTPARRWRRSDPFSPGGEAGRRPDRATAVYAHKCREAFRGVPVVIGGIEASLRRLAHWDHWSSTVKPSMLLSSKADLLVYGMGERAVVTIARALAEGQSVQDLAGMPSSCSVLRGELARAAIGQQLPSFEECRDHPELLAEVTRAVCQRLPASQRSDLLQRHGDQLVRHRPPAPAPTQAELDRWYALPFSRSEHPSLPAPVPALETVRWSVVTHRGCFGGCSFCALAEHQGREVVSRSREAILAELRQLSATPGFPGVISDLGGPSANMYGLGCGRDDGGDGCRRRSCLFPKSCQHLDSDPGPWLELLESARALPGLRQIRVASGVRMDLLLRHRRALEVLVAHHVGGQLKVAPEHDGASALEAMRKYRPGTLRRFKEAFDAACARRSKPQYLVAYLMAGHPGTSLREMAELSRELEALGLRPRQVQDFTPTPMTISTAQHVSGNDPLTGRAIAPVRGDRARADQRALLQWFLPENRRRAERLLRRHGLAKPSTRRRRRR